MPSEFVSVPGIKMPWIFIPITSISYHVKFTPLMVKRFRWEVNFLSSIAFNGQNILIFMKEIAVIAQDTNAVCTECGGSIILTKIGYTCSKCGIVQGKHFTSDNFFLNQNEKYDVKTSKQFVALGKQLDNVSDLGSYIDFYKTGYFFDVKNMPLPPDKQKLFFRLKYTRDFRARLDQNETYYRIVKIMKDVSNNLNFLADARKRAVYLYNKMIKGAPKTNNKVPNHVSLIATSLFLASREYCSYAPVTIQEICLAFQDLGHRVNCKMIIRDMLEFKQYMDLKRINHDSKDYLERLTNNLYYDKQCNARFEKKNNRGDLKPYIQEIKAWSLKILELIPKFVKNSRNPFILAGAAVYGADWIIARKKGTKRVLTQKLLADATGIAEYSIRDHYCSVIKQIIEKM
jgi:transcription initiation factor TFIIIB Brf1 subunit/transcription initiation factor TFIIB